jgi:hypothetical protein
VFADWMLNTESLRFHRAMANRVWKQLFGRGLVEPADDLRDGNPPSHPELLEFLSSTLRDQQCDLLRFVASVMSTDAYARSCASVHGNERDTRYATRAWPRPLPASAAVDALADACGIDLQFDDLPGATRAAEVPDEDGGCFSLRVLGASARDGTRDPATPPIPTVAAALHMLHGPPAEEWLLSPTGRVASLVQRKVSADAAVQELFLASLSRFPNKTEMELAMKQLGSTLDARKLADVLWALVTTSEFAFNH